MECPLTLNKHHVWHGDDRVNKTLVFIDFFLKFCLQKHGYHDIFKSSFLWLFAPCSGC